MEKSWNFVFEFLWEPCKHVFWVLKKNRLIETVLLSTHNMFWLKNVCTLIWRPGINIAGK